MLLSLHRSAIFINSDQVDRKPQKPLPIQTNLPHKKVKKINGELTTPLPHQTPKNNIPKPNQPTKKKKTIKPNGHEGGRSPYFSCLKSGAFENTFFPKLQNYSFVFPLPFSFFYFSPCSRREDAFSHSLQQTSLIQFLKSPQQQEVEKNSYFFISVRCGNIKLLLPELLLGYCYLFELIEPYEANFQNVKSVLLCCPWRQRE